MTGGGAGIPLKYILLKGKTMIQDHEPTIVNNYTTTTSTPEQRFSQPVLTTEKEPIQYEYLISFLTGAEHIHADHVELGDTWTIAYMTVELDDGSKHEVRSAQRTALIADIDRVPKTLLDKEADAMVEKGLDKLLKEEGK